MFREDMEELVARAVWKPPLLEEQEEQKDQKMQEEHQELQEEEKEQDDFLEIEVLEGEDDEDPLGLAWTSCSFPHHYGKFPVVQLRRSRTKRSVSLELPDATRTGSPKFKAWKMFQSGLEKEEIFGDWSWNF